MLKLRILVTILCLLMASVAWGQAVITLPGGQVSLGVAARGQLGAGTLPAGSNAAGSEFGIYYAANKWDGIAPGCFCEGWGVSANGVAGWAANDNGDNGAIAGVSFASTASTATSVTTLTGTTLQITQAYAPAAASGAASGVLFVNSVTLTNTGSATLTNVRYSRAMDWDIPPTEFNEFVTIQGWPASALIASSDDGFSVPNPLGTLGTIMSGTANVNFSKKGPADHGAAFTFAFGDLAAGASKNFKIFYGVAGNEAGATAALSAAAAEVFSLGYSTLSGAANVNSAVWAFGFAGVGGTPIGTTPTTTTVPTLSVWGLVLLAILLSGIAALRIRKAHART